MQVTAPMLRTASILALACAWHAGCTGGCQGPGCAEEFAAARLTWLGPPFDGVSVLPRDAIARWDGGFLDDAERTPEGTDWSAVFLGATVLIGQPDAERVVRVEAREDRVVVPQTTYQARSSDFGAALMLRRRGAVTDLWVGAPSDTRSQGAIHVFRNVEDDPELVTTDDAELRIVGRTAADELGTSMLACPDWTGDGLGEVLVAAPRFAASAAEPTVMPVPNLAGAVFLLTSEALAGRTGTVSITEIGRGWWGEEIGHGAGTGIACDEAGIYVGAPWVRPEVPTGDANAAQGRVYVLPVDPIAEPGRLDEVASAVLEGPTPDGWFGTALAALDLGEVRALVVGAPGANGGIGQVDAYRIQAGLPPGYWASFLPDPDHGIPDHLGRSLASGDFDGDGLSDLLVGAPDYRADSESYDVGRLWLWAGSGAGGWSEDGQRVGTADHVIRGTQPFMRIGRGVHVGDADGDGTDDLLVPTRAETLQ